MQEDTERRADICGKRTERKKQADTPRKTEKKWERRHRKTDSQVDRGIWRSPGPQSEADVQQNGMWGRALTRMRGACDLPEVPGWGGGLLWQS